MAYYLQLSFFNFYIAGNVDVYAMLRPKTANKCFSHNSGFGGVVGSAFEGKELSYKVDIGVVGKLIHKFLLPLH